MNCGHCASPATYHLTEVRQGRSVEVHLCQHCAWERAGIASEPAVNEHGQPTTLWRLQEDSPWRPTHR